MQRQYTNLKLPTEFPFQEEDYDCEGDDDGNYDGSDDSDDSRGRQRNTAQQANQDAILNIYPHMRPPYVQFEDDAGLHLRYGRDGELDNMSASSGDDMIQVDPDVEDFGVVRTTTEEVKRDRPNNGDE